MEGFGNVIAELERRIKDALPRRLEFVAGIRVNAAPHIGTYLTLASTFVFASRAARSSGVPCAVRVHFLDNDPVPSVEDYAATHFHCVYQMRTPKEGAQFIRDNYLAFLDELTALTGCACEPDLYSDCQGDPEFRAIVLRSLAEWKNIKYSISGPPPANRPAGVRGLGFPCPECGLYNGQTRPTVELLHAESAIIGSECCSHGAYTVNLAPAGNSFLNLETTFRNAIKEIMALKNRESLSVMMKGVDWSAWLADVDHVLALLGVSKADAPPRFLLPVVQTDDGIKLSKSAILHSADGLSGLDPRLLDMKILRQEVADSTAKILAMSERILDSAAFARGQVSAAGILRALA